jgi:hypothetical protein
MTYTIEDNLERYTRFISKLRDNVVTSSHNPYPDEGVISSAPAAKVLLPARGGDGPMWWNIRLKVDEKTWTTIALRGDDLCICGFRNQKGDWYEIEPNTMFDYPNTSPLWMGSVANRVSEKSVVVSYHGHQQLTKVVRELSQLDEERRKQMASWSNVTWPPVMTLQLMVSYSASIYGVHDAVRRGWGLEWAETDEMLQDLISRWKNTYMGALPEGALDDFALVKMAGPQVQGGGEEE